MALEGESGFFSETPGDEDEAVDSEGLEESERDSGETNETETGEEESTGDGDEDENGEQAGEDEEANGEDEEFEGGDDETEGEDGGIEDDDEDGDDENGDFEGDDEDGDDENGDFEGDDEDGDGENGEDADESAIIGLTVDDEAQLVGAVELTDDDQILVQADERRYWRTAIFDHFTEDTWESTVGTVDDVDHSGERFEQTVIAATTIDGLPAAAQPVETDRDVTWDEHGQPSPTAPLEPGDSYVVESALVERSEDALRGAGTDYPASVEDRYLQRPDGISEEFDQYTADVTAGSEGPYETATAIESYLRQSHTYSLDIEKPDGNIAEAFLLEMDEGYCAYFATTMVQMLRAEDVPARYVTGYGGGEATEDGYLAKAYHAHAWVEVYFPDHGWVVFEPTAPSDRLEIHASSAEVPAPEEDETTDPAEETDEDADEDDLDDEDETDEEDFEEDTETDEESEEENEEDAVDDDEGDDDTVIDEDEEAQEITIELEDSAPVPGDDVLVKVTRADEPVEGWDIFVNGDLAETTNEQGEAIVTVPYTEQLEISASPAGDSVHSNGGTAPVTSGVSVPMSGGANEDATEKFETYTNMSIDIDGVALPGSEVEVTAALADVPVETAIVRMDGETVGFTDENGTAPVTLPVESDEVVITVSRGDIEERTELELAELEVSVEERLPLPGRSVTVTVTADGEPIDGADVLVDGSVEATNITNGTATVTLPLAGSATLVAELPTGTTGEMVVDGLLRNGAIVLGLAIGGVLVLLLVARRRGLSVRRGGRSVLDQVRLRAIGAWRRLLSGIVAAGRGLERIVRGVGRTVRTISRALRGEWAQLLASLRATIGWARSVGRRRVAGIRTICSRRFVRQALRNLLAWFGSLRSNRGTAPKGREDAGANVTSDDISSDDENRPRSVRELWRAFVAVVRPPGLQTRTPGEIGRYAIDRGLPRGAVETVVEAYRDVEYGTSDPPAERVESVAKSVSDIEERERRNEQRT